MREIKFRAYDFYGDGNMVYCGGDSLRLSELVGESKREWLMQYTGLKDNTKWEDLSTQEQADWINRGKLPEEWHGREIYEGDIVKYNFNYRGTQPENEGWIKFPVVYQGYGYFAGNCGLSAIIHYGGEVIGNIHEHGFLLEK
jgi:hypothetical protein